MIKYQLGCASCNYSFEAWFRNSSDYDDQEKSGLLECPSCNSKNISKALMAPNVQTSEKKVAASVEFLKLKDYIKNNFEDVGSRFADEAIAIANGDSEDRNIYGSISKEDGEILDKEGIDYIPLPWRDREDA